MPERDLAYLVAMSDRILGCSLGGAVGDALGAPIETVSREQIREKFRSERVQEFADTHGWRGAITYARQGIQ